jgi:hypothetical protein
LTRASCLQAFSLTCRKRGEGSARVDKVGGGGAVVEAGDAAVGVDGLGHDRGGGGGGLGGCGGEGHG